LFEAGALQPDSALTGTFEHDEHLADVDSVREAINEARYEAMIRQQGREEAHAQRRPSRERGRRRKI
jgi:RIO kinase 1